MVPPQFALLIIGLSAYVLLAVQLPAFENSTATPPILGVPQPVPTNQTFAPIVTFPTVAVLKLFARVCTLVGSETVNEFPFVLDHTNWVYVVPVN